MKTKIKILKNYISKQKDLLQQQIDDEEWLIAGRIDAEVGGLEDALEILIAKDCPRWAE